jgi:hypothetical protein
MKRFALVALVAAMVFSLATSVSATELKVRGNLDVYGMWSANLYDFDSDTADGDNYTTTQRMRAYFDYVANENLKAVLGFEMDMIWGQNDADWGGDLNEGGELEIKHVYMDFNFPDTAINVQAGLQYIALPSVFGNPVFDDDAAAITISAPINDMFGVTVGYTRGVDGSTTFDGNGDDNDDKDMAFIVTPVTLDGFSIAPYFGYAWIGANSDDSTASDVYDYEVGDIGDLENVVVNVPYEYDIDNLEDDATVWVLGFNTELTMFDPLTIAADLIYGELDADDYESKGWYGALAGSYKMDMLTATLFGVYFSGADEDEDEDDMLPQLAEGWGLTPYVGGVRAFSTSWDTFSGVDNAMWAIGLKLSQIQFIDKLTHDLTIHYAEGTSDEDAGMGFDEKDSAWEVWMVNKYMIYENLAAINELGFFAPDFDDADDEDNSYFATVGFQYKF